MDKKKNRINYIKINKRLETAGWHFSPEGAAPVNIRFESSVTIKSSDMEALGENFENTSKSFIEFLPPDTKNFPLILPNKLRFLRQQNHDGMVGKRFVGKSR